MLIDQADNVIHDETAARKILRELFTEMAHFTMDTGHSIKEMVLYMHMRATHGPVSIRGLAQASGFPVETVRRALKRNEERGYVRVTQEGYRELTEAGILVGDQLYTKAFERISALRRLDRAMGG